MAEMTTKDVVLALGEKVDRLIESHHELKGSLAPTVATLADHESRIRALEKLPHFPGWGKLSAFIGSAASVAFTIGYFIK